MWVSLEQGPTLTSKDMRAAAQSALELCEETDRDQSRDLVRPAKSESCAISVRYRKVEKVSPKSRFSYDGEKGASAGLERGTSGAKPDTREIAFGCQVDAMFPRRGSRPA